MSQVFLISEEIYKFIQMLFNMCCLTLMSFYLITVTVILNSFISHGMCYY